MDSKIRIIFLMLGMIPFMPSFCCATETADSLVLDRMWEYRRNYAHNTDKTTQNIYMRYTLNNERRNPTLFFVPTLYTIARGDRSYIGEMYGKLFYDELQQYNVTRQVVSGTIPSNRRITPMMLQFLTPNIYGMTLYHDQLLSPFHQSNRRFYRYSVVSDEGKMARIVFRPRISNTQLVSGRATVDNTTGRIDYVAFDGEYDMMKFHVEVVQGNNAANSSLPERSETEVRFRFMGNKLNANFSAIYNADITLPDSIDECADRALMETLRPIPLKKNEEEIYRQYDERHQQRDSTQTDSVQHRNRFKEIAWDVIGDHLVNSLHADVGAASLRLSPLLNPLYLSYSHSHGLAYRLDVGARYSWNAYRYLTLSARMGYNFRIKQFYFTAPLRMTYNPKRNGYAEITWANGNRIGNSSVSQAIIEEQGEKAVENADIYTFDDNYVQAVNNVAAFDWLEVMAGIIYHRRRAVNAQAMQEFGRPTEYRSFAPLLTLRFTPWSKGPVLTFNYERSIRGVMLSNLQYERIELDASYKYRMPCMRVLNFRVGSGFYTDKHTTYFVDFSNFHDENLPDGWDDEWTGQFQLLDGSWYNLSNYYLRAHTSYESPLLCLSWLPWIGRYVETERIYLSMLSIEHTRAYSELGYGFSNRFFSVGMFASFLNLRFHEFGCKFTFELFRKW